MSDMKAHVLRSGGEDECGIPEGVTLAMVHPAKQGAVDYVLKQRTAGNDGRSPWVWVRLPNGDLILGVFPQGDTYFSVEDDAQFPDAGWGAEPRSHDPRAERIRDLQEENSRLRAALRVNTDYLADLIDTGKFPAKGRSADDKDQALGWWEDRSAAIITGYAALLGVSREQLLAENPSFRPGPGPLEPGMLKR